MLQLAQPQPSESSQIDVMRDLKSPTATGRVYHVFAQQPEHHPVLSPRMFSEDSKIFKQQQQHCKHQHRRHHHRVGIQAGGKCCGATPPRLATLHGRLPSVTPLQGLAYGLSFTAPALLQVLKLGSFMSITLFLA